ncbi:MAG: DNA-directed RNA polymerase subunit beta', partial [Patescibacteria group bacterium]
GRVLINEIFPAEYPYVNDALDTRKLKAIMREIYKLFGIEVTARVADALMSLGFKFAEKSGMTMSIFDIDVPETKKKLIAQGEEAVDVIAKRYRRGLISADERRKLSIEKWSDIRNQMEKEVKDSFKVNSSIWTMVTSGARGSSNQLVQLAGMKGLVVNPSGSIIEVPITSNYKEGLTVLEYFISTHGSRKGKSDTSLKTADAGYLTRRLVDVSQDLVITVEDCATPFSITVIEAESSKYGESYVERLIGRATAEAVKDKAGKTVIKKGEEITEDHIDAIIAAQVTEVKVRSTLHCQAKWGICQKCYGRDLATGNTVKIGTAVGIMAAQAIGEPGTQLTMKTFHMGGVSGGDITSGLPRVEEIFEARPPHNPAILSEISGRVVVHEAKDKQYIDIVSDEILSEDYKLESDYVASVKEKDVVKAKQAIATSPEKKAIRSGITGRVSIKGKTITVTSTEPLKSTYTVTGDIGVLVKSGDKIEVGQQLTEGHIDPNQSLDLLGVEKTQDYIIREVQNIYASHGAGVNEKHIEIIARSMFAKVRLIDGGDSSLLRGQVASRLDIDRMNEEMKKKGKRIATYEQIVLGITRASLQTDSFLSAASFQETTRVLIEAAIKGAIDPLRGLKENVIIGKLIPAGTGFDPEMIGRPVIP